MKCPMSVAFPIPFPARLCINANNLCYRYVFKNFGAANSPKINYSTRPSRTSLLSMAVGSCAISSDDVVVKSPTDRRLYRYIQLTNGLCALLVHDPEIYSDEPSGDLKTDNSEEEDEDEDDEEEEDSDEGEEDGEDDDDEEENEDVKESKGSAQKKVSYLATGCSELELKILEICSLSSVELSNSAFSALSSIVFFWQAAAALCVGMGSFSDPYEAQGLAHFLGFQIYFELRQFCAIE